MILTGYGWIDYACAAAVLLRKYPKAEVCGVSKGRFPEFLSDIAMQSDKLPSHIIILGVGLTSDFPRLLNAVKKLHSDNVKLEFFSVLPMEQPATEKSLEKYMEIHIDENCARLAEFINAHYQIQAEDLCELALDKQDKNAHLNTWYYLIQAAMHQYRAYQNPAAYPEAIRSLSAGRPGAISPAQHKMLEHYRQYGHRELVGKSKAIDKLRGIVNTIGPQDKIRVLIYGETGTGKETVAMLLHFKSPRHDERFIAFNCACLTPQLLESRLFGHEKGAFTGASERSIGLFEEASNGTLFLDEIAELTEDAQAGLLRILQEKKYRRLGGKEDLETNVRIIAATNRNLMEMVKKGEFRADLFYRLNTVQIYTPPLRESPEDIRVIANSYWMANQKSFLNQDQLDILTSYKWPGNVREMINLLDRAIAFDMDDFSVLLEDHKTFWNHSSDKTEEIPENCDELIRWRANALLKKYDNNISRTAEAMKMARNTFKKYVNEK